MKNSRVKIGLIQMKAFANPDINLVRAVAKIEEAARRGAKIICLQELFLTPYFPQEKNKKFFKLAESIPSLFIEELQEAAKDNKVVLIVPVFEKSKNAYYNSVVVINNNGKILGTYRKMHIPDDPGFYEKFYFKPGNLGFKVFNTSYGKIGVLICWDQWFPEAARNLALKGAQILFYPTAIGWDVRRKDKEQKIELEAWQTIQRSHAIANNIHIAAVNRVGKENNLQFWGNSFIAGPFGEIVKQAPGSNEEILIAEINILRNQEMKRAWPFFRDRRTDSYGS